MRTKQAWLVAVGSGNEPLPDSWIKERPDLLEGWPVGNKEPSGIQSGDRQSGDRLIYYAAHHQRLIAVGRATEDGARVVGALGIQLYLAVPIVPFAPHWGVLAKPPEAIEGQKAITLTDDEYETGLAAFLDRAHLPDD